ncbi:putative cofD-like protein [Tumebacillus sp. BK434]|uniref:YvcK family protein n=1 Tax=Tumebacillus sp. BK434 TaxID=2512169 RepID=UPI0010F362B0|nr:YvcK family protein [Tumebacillus sp. BK434]TCP55853.1 putative cofD-like protein [Tumebacillus sp. BK434]
MVRYWLLLAWTVCSFGLGLIAAGIGIHSLPGQSSLIGLVCLLMGSGLLAFGWWRDEQITRTQMLLEKRKPRVVVVGGGTGLSVLLRGLKEFDIDITAIVTVADDGGSSGRLRSDFDMPPPGDIRSCLVALSDQEPLLEKLWSHRFKSGEGLAGHSFGNLLIAALTDVTGDFETAIKEASRVLAVGGRVLPAVREAVILRAYMEDGSFVEGESQIPLSGKKIERVEVEPNDLEPLPEALEAIEQADVIVIGPGSLYTSILPNLLVTKLTQAIDAAVAKKVYICNVMTQSGETDHYTASDHVKAIYDHIGLSLFDYILVNSAPIPPAVIEQYREKRAAPVVADLWNLQNLGLNVIARNFLHYSIYARHDARMISEQILALIGRDPNKLRR